MLLSTSQGIRQFVKINSAEVPLGSSLTKKLAEDQVDKTLLVPLIPAFSLHLCQGFQIDKKSQSVIEEQPRWAWLEA